jgi:hypothetical protein
MIRQLVAIVLLVCSVSVSLSNFVMHTIFSYNQNTLAKEFCVNKNKPQLHCNGKCYLLKKLKQAQEKEQQQDQKLRKILLQEAVIMLPFKLNTYRAEEGIQLVPHCAGKPVTHAYSVFHPPQPPASYLFLS